jgi:hypothetical protein
MLLRGRVRRVQLGRSADFGCLVTPALRPTRLNRFVYDA